MKRLLAAVSLAIAIPLAAATPRPWTSVATPAPQGSYVIGNPKARVKLIEYVSYTCPHCGHFAADSAATLKGKFVASGSTSVEIRSSVHDKYDLVAATLARCSGSAVFPKLHDAFFAQQSTWLDRAVNFDSANAQRISTYPVADQYRALADGAGLSDIAKASGMTDAGVRACLANPATVQKTLDVAQAMSGKIKGTPSFELDGKLIENTDWAKLEPMLRAAGAK
ncbi:DsbA family protein [Sphingomonas sp. SUN019]|uniref:DsbA family protein n=1 Tax=Sphingomonas sp. SUN019 TaxID=2937788 RepID=UPI002164C7EF|nr:DsbA family protein [Sphingomonas sp. SUN019]UVO51465.1 DsbA family protein [Sphingomonas sp. SUN019]